MPAWRVDKTFDYAIPDELIEKVAIGSLVRIPFGARKVRGVVLEIAEPERGSEKWAELSPIASLVFDVSLAPPPHDELMTWLAHRYVVPMGRAFDRIVPPRVRVKAPATVALQPFAGDRLATYEGGNDLLTALASAQPGTWIVQTLSGEGRGRLIAEMIGACLRSGRAALVSVPEVRYGSPVLDELAEIYPETARTDSAVTDAERSKSWLALAGGHELGAGGRNTVLAPAPRLGLIVIDEEHHQSYKEDRAPRFDARRVAVERARLQGATCVLMSATPSVASAGLPGLRWVTPARSARRAARPVIEVAQPEEGRWLGSVLHARIREALARKEKVGLLVPVRGYARALWCAACRRTLRCPRCEAGVFFDKEAAAVRCVRCGFRAPEPNACPSCGKPELRYLGAGSERMTEQLAKAFPRARVYRMDASTMDQEVPADVDVYVTTWIGTKEVVRPRAQLVGVIDADAFIHRADFRSAEHAYQALSEMAEWAGPASAGGRLVIQTVDSMHHSIQAVVRGDYRYFLDHELDARRELTYPPFSELVKVSAVGTESRALIDEVVGLGPELGVRVLGPIEVIRRTASGATEQTLEVLIKCADAGAVAERLRVILPRVPAGTFLRVDVDPR